MVTKTKVSDAIQIIAGDRHRLIILIGGFESGKTLLIKELAEELNGRYINLNLDLTERLLAMPRNRYADGVTVHETIDNLCDEYSLDGRPLFVDNIEILFSPELGKINPVDTFKRISRQRVVVLALPARRQGDYAEYSQIGRDDYFRIPLEEYTVIEMGED
jgi:hypothetical protein